MRSIAFFFFNSVRIKFEMWRFRPVSNVSGNLEPRKRKKRDITELQIRKKRVPAATLEIGL